MALTVPTFDDPMNQVKPEALPGARVAVGSPADAFNAGPSAEKMQNAGMTAAKDTIDYATQQKDMANQIAHIQMDTAASQKQTQIQVDVSKMKGQDAFQAPEYAAKQWQDFTSQIQDQAVGQAQKMALAQTLGQRSQDLNKSVQLHVATESQNFADQTYQGANDQARTAAIVNAGDDAQVQQNLDIQDQLFQGWAKLKGIPQTNPDGSDNPLYKDKLQAETSATKLGVIHARLQSGLDDAAQKFFDDNKAGMSAADIQNANNALDSSKVIGESNDIFNDVLADKKYKFSDGSLNMEAIRQHVMESTKEDGVSDQKALKILGQVKAQGAEYNRDRYHQIAANERDFANEVIQGRQNNVSLQDALKAAPKWGHDAYDIAQKTAFINATYAPPADTHVIAHEQLKEGIQAGSVELADIDRAADQGVINRTDQATLRQLKLKTAADGTDPMMKNANTMINTMATKAIGNDKEALAQFQYVLGQKTQGMNPDQKLAIATDELKKVPNPDSWFWGSISKYKQDAKQIIGKDTATGAMYEDVGFKQAQAISSGLTGQSGHSANPAANVQAFANTLGVKYEDMKIGTPVNNAIQSLQAKGRAVTPDAVQKVLKQHPDGMWK